MTLDPRIVEALPKKTETHACQCERALLSWETFTNRLICHKCEKVFSERDRTIDLCLTALSSLDLAVCPSEEAILKCLIITDVEEQAKAIHTLLKGGK